jgi:hypothetical protein
MLILERAETLPKDFEIFFSSIIGGSFKAASRDVQKSPAVSCDYIGLRGTRLDLTQKLHMPRYSLLDCFADPGESKGVRL